MRLKGARAATAFARPSLLTLAEAYIEGHADIEGDVDVAIHGAEAISRSGSKPMFDPQRLRAPQPARRPRGDPAPLRRLQRLLRAVAGPAHGVLVRVLPRRRTTRSRRRRRRSSTTSAASCAAARRALPRHRLRLGRARDARGRATTAWTPPASRCRRTSSTSPASASARRACRTAAACCCATTATLPGEGVYDKIASVGMFEHVGLRNLPGLFRHRAPRCCKRGGCSSTTASRPRHGERRRGTGRGRVHRPLRVPARRAAAPAPRRARHERCRTSRCTTWSACGPTTRRHSPSGAPPSSAHRCGGRRLERATARIWRLYLAGCAYGFEQGWMSIHQVLATKRTRPGPTALPLTRDWIYPA